MNKINDGAWKNEMKIRLDFNNMMTDFVGEHGISIEDIDKISDKIENAKKAMVEKRANGKMDWRDLPYNQDEVVEDILSYVNEQKDKFEAFVVLGIGGSALGPIAVQQAINHPYYNELPRDKRIWFKKLYVSDNV